MNILTVLLGCAIHIILILLFEGIFLFAILYPILTRVATSLTIKLRNLIYGLFYKVINNIDTKNLLVKNDKKNFYNGMNVLIKACAIDEIEFIATHKYIPYIIYAVLLFVLLICCIVIIIISKKINIKIDYLFIIVNSIIGFALICGYAFLVLWFILATQPYVLNLEDGVLEVILEVYNSS